MNKVVCAHSSLSDASGKLDMVCNHALMLMMHFPLAGPLSWGQMNLSPGQMNKIIIKREAPALICPASTESGSTHHHHIVIN